MVLSIPNLLKKGLTSNTMYGIVLIGRYPNAVKKGEDMDIQMKRGLLDVCVLAAIKGGESYGYQILKDIKPFIAMSESTLYPILRRLEAARYLTVRSAEHNGRLRKYYRITPEGLERIQVFSEEWKEIISIYNFITKKDEDTQQIKSNANLNGGI